ncbi:MAG TPA: response regulator, partial [Telluria sp.]|nr:response regulator [Telluria sp.]
TDALHMAPGNMQVMIALASAILRQIDELGWDHPLGELCAKQIDDIRALDPAHSQLGHLVDQFNAAKRKYGIASTA